MLDVTYDYIWDEIIQPNINQLLETIENTNPKSLIEFEVISPNPILIKSQVYANYNRKKERLKELYHYNEGNEESRIDIHKIAACFAAVLIEDKVFDFTIKDGITDDVFLLNARLAYKVSVDIIYMGLIYRYIKKGKQHIVEQLLKQKGLKMPPTTLGHDEYNLGREKTIALNDVFGNEFDILTYSDMLFWIEYYNRQLLEQKLCPEL